MRIIVLDPGETTGKTTWEFQNNYLRLLDGELIENYLEYNWNILLEYDLVLIEDFLLYPNKSERMIFNRFVPAKILGIVEYICYKNKIPLEKQRAIDIKKFISLKVLKDLKCWFPSEHLKDSSKHCLTYFVKKYKDKLIVNDIKISDYL